MRKSWAWVAVAGFLWATVVWMTIRALYLTLALEMPLSVLLLGGLGEVLKISFMLWLVLRIWPKYRKEFING
ncbi:hypothetical protein DB347_25415 [Opitutaceae bacterium EW11]|nr:hypothetical protein DB347_25415 [Opitutaceae bacterium EW11]